VKKNPSPSPPQASQGDLQQDLIRDTLREEMDTTQPPCRDSYNCYRRGGARRWLNGILFPLISSAGNSLIMFDPQQDNEE